MRSRVIAGEGGAPAALRRAAEAIPPGSGAVVMGSGVVSIDLALGGAGPLSLLTLAVAGATWVLLGLLRAAGWGRGRGGAGAAPAGPAALSAVAATAVLGTRLTLLGWHGAGAVLVVVASLLWLGLTAQVLRQWTVPTVGASFMLTVSTELLAVLLASLGLAGRMGWLVLVALVPLALGVALYAFVLRSFDLRQLRVGRGDQWVAGGALAISALACAWTAQAAHALGLLGDGTALRGATLVLWLLAACWLPVLALTELVARRRSYDARRWSTVFPVGMYAACSFATGTALPAAPITRLAEVWTWVALAVWAVVLAATLGRPLALRRGGRGSDPPRDAGDRRSG